MDPASKHVQDDDDDPGLFSYFRPPTAEANAPSGRQTFEVRPPEINVLVGYGDRVPPLTAPMFGADQVPRRRAGFAYPESPGYVPQNKYDEDFDVRSVGLDSSALSSNDSMDPRVVNVIRHARSSDTTDEVISLKEFEKNSDRQTNARSVTAASTLPYFNGSEPGPDEDSPYPEVRASVSNYDDVEMPVMTFRSWTLGILMSAIFGGINCFLNLRYPAPLVYPIVVQVVVHPLGKLFDWIMPLREWKTPRLLKWIGFGDHMSLNPGPWNIKEHTFVIIMANTAITPGFSLNYTVALKKFYNIDINLVFDYLLLLSTQVSGFGLAGFMRRFLVWPAELIWPTDLVICTLLNTLHAEEDDFIEEGQKPGLSRFRFFIYVLCGAFLWYFVPGFLFQALSVFSFVCWIAPKNVIVNQLFGFSSGLGLSIITFDWNQISFIGGPLVMPWWAQVNILCGFIFCFCIVLPLIYYNNVWFSAYMPIMTTSVYDRYGQPYNTTAVFDQTTRSLNVAAYEAYSPVFMASSYLITIMVDFAIAPACIVHTFLFHGKTIWRQLAHTTKPADEDIHAKLMRNYPEVPDSWYLTFWIAAVGLSILVVGVWPSSGLPIWALLIGLVIGWIYILPGGFIFATTGETIVINLIVELIGGYLLPGNPLGNMLFKVYATQAMGLAVSFAQDLKLGHYMKVPPRATFLGQVVAVTITSIVQVGIVRWMFHSVPDLCSTHQSALLTCPNATVFHSVSVLWGLIGPSRLFSVHKLYSPTLLAMIVGVVLPVLIWALNRRLPNTWIQYVNIPIVLTGISFAPPATGINFTSFALTGFIFQYMLRRYFFRVWSKYNFVLSAGMDSGTILSTLFIFVALQLPKEGTIALNWWGNNVFTNTLDWDGVSWLTPPTEGFGPTQW